MDAIFEIDEGKQRMTTDETIVFSITTTNWISSPTVGTVTVYDENDNDADVTSTVMPSGSHSDSGDVITLKPLTALTIGHSYRVEVQFTAGSSTYECYMIVKCTR